MRVSAELAPTSSSWLGSLANALARDINCKGPYQHSRRPTVAVSPMLLSSKHAVRFFDLKIFQRSQIVSDGYVRIYACPYID
jgi:hypothetical protein